MPFKSRKPSERPKQEPDQDGFKPDENPLEIAWKQFFRWLNTRLGWPLGAVVMAVVLLWIGWDKVKELPGVAPLLTNVVELRSIPRAQGDKFSILVAKLGNDKDGLHRGLIDDALRGRFDKGEIEVLLPDRKRISWTRSLKSELAKGRTFEFEAYGLLHSPDYRERYADNLSKELPRIPRVRTAADFWAFS